MTSPASVAFRVIDRPFVLWSHDSQSENIKFLDSIDSDFYHRTVQNLFCDEKGNLRIDADNSDARKDVSSLARLIWNHGLETLVMLLGAYIQAPFAVHGFFLKCENKDCREIARYLLSGQIPESHCLTNPQFDFDAFVRGIHAGTIWANDEATMSNFARSLRGMLREYDRNDHRAEYNSIKHGLRARHGRFAVAFGLEDTPGVPAPEENITMLSDSMDGSHFFTIKTFPNVSKKIAREQFSVRHSSVGWSLEKTLLDIQIFSSWIGNVVSAIKIAMGALPKSVQFFRPDVDPAWWDSYFEEYRENVRNFTIGATVEPPVKFDDAEKQAVKYYRARSNARRIGDDQQN
jgi:hypothetical protein